jgi:preprotein translocase subunit YajC
MMQESTSITFTPIQHHSVVKPWEIALAIVVFAGLIYFAIRRSRKYSKERASLSLR